MSRKEIKNQMGQLKQQLKSDNQVIDVRLLKLALIMVILAIVAAFVHGRIQLW